MKVNLSQAEAALSLTEAAKRIPGRPSKDTIRRWISKGLASGAKLEAFRSGGALFTTEEAIARFLAAQNAGATCSHRTAAAKRDLDAMGV